MRKFLFIFVAILAYLMLSSKSCDSDAEDDSVSQEAELKQTKEAIINEFESDDLSRKSLRAFEAKAEQKLIDLADYLNIYNDKANDETFRDQARQMILDLFISDSILINNLLSGEKDEKNLPIQEYLKANLASAYNSINFICDSIEIVKPLRRTDDFNFKGRLSFSRRTKMCSSSDTIITGPNRMEVEIFASKVKKQFGSDTLLIWSVFLGSIK